MQYRASEIVSLLSELKVSLVNYKTFTRYSIQFITKIRKDTGNNMFNKVGADVDDLGEP